jgi:hypothetical protein
MATTTAAPVPGKLDPDDELFGVELSDPVLVTSSEG